MANKPKPSITVISGCMFSSKTDRLIIEFERSKFAKWNVVAFKPSTDVRYDINKIVTHDKKEIDAVVIKKSSEILDYVKKNSNIEVVCIDEAQFFDDELPSVCEYLANTGIRVITAGLDKNYLGQPFGPMSQLLALAEYTPKVFAVCVDCGDLEANHSYRITEETEEVSLGEKDKYIPLCRSCFNIRRNKKENAQYILAFPNGLGL